MTLQQLEYIIALEETGNFTKAAAKCFVTQPSLSSMIQKLEEELEVKIFDREKKPVVPTLVGKIILQKAHELLKQSEQIKECIEEQRKSLKGEFRLGIIPTIAPSLLPLFFQNILTHYPQLHLSISEMKTSEIKEALNNGELDGGIVAELNGMDSFHIDSLYFEQFYSYVSREDSLFKNSVIKTSELKDKQLWLLEEGHCFRDQLIQFCKFNTSRLACEPYHLGSLETFMRIVENGEGITFIPELVKNNLNDKQKELVRPFSVPTPTRHIVLLTREDYIRDSIRNMFVKEIQSVVPKQMLKRQVSQQIV